MIFGDYGNISVGDVGCDDDIADGDDGCDDDVVGDGGGAALGSSSLLVKLSASPNLLFLPSDTR